MKQSSFERWYPFRVYRDAERTLVDWLYLNDLRFDEPFYFETMQRAMRRPFNGAFYRTTSIDTLLDVAEQSQTVALSGLIFHQSRCGSTLAARAFAHRLDTLVISEAGPVNDILKVTTDPHVRASWLRAVVAVLGRPLDDRARHFILKLDAWHANDAPAFQAAFPRVPMVFLYRHPLEILVSHAQGPSFMMSGAHAPVTLGIDVQSAMRLSPPLLHAKVLARIARSAADAFDDPQALINFDEFPEAIWQRIAPRFGIAIAERDVELVRRVAQYHAKRPGERYVDDRDAKRGAAAPLLHEEAHNAGALHAYEVLESRRLRLPV